MDKKYTKKQLAVQWTALILSCVVLICGIAVVYALFFNPQRTFTITETFRITSASDSETYLRVSLPMSGGYQEISNLLVEGAYEYTVEYFNGWRDLTIIVPSSDYEVVISISFTAKLFRNVGPWAGDVLDEYTLPQQFIDSDNESIIALAAQLRGSNDFQTAQNIHDYVNDLISWPIGDRINVTQLYASELLESPVGVCGDFAILMTALLRAEGIPTRTISGLVFSSNRLAFRSTGNWIHPGGAHGWVEFFADGKWHFADPSWGIFNRNTTKHLSFGTYCMNSRSDFQRNLIYEVEDKGFYVSSNMSAPFRFILYSSDENATLIPRGYVSFSWFR